MGRLGSVALRYVATSIFLLLSVTVATSRERIIGHENKKIKARGSKSLVEKKQRSSSEK
jgi:hypothetical protein